MNDNMIRTGFRDLDELTGGFLNGNLIMLCSRPSMGKTTLAINILINLIPEQKRCAYLSYEASKDMIVRRALGCMASVEIMNLCTGRLSDEECERLGIASEQLVESGSIIDDTLRNVCSLSAYIRELSKREAPDLFIIDYLELLNNDRSEFQSRFEEVYDTLTMLKGLAIEINRPILILSQLDRSVEKRKNHRPMLFDILHGADELVDEVIFLYRGDYYNKESNCKNIAELTIAKDSGGKCGTVEVVFLPEYLKFANLER